MSTFDTNHDHDNFAVPNHIAKSRASMSTSHYDVYKDGYPIDNPPVVISNINYERYLETPSLFDDTLKHFKVFGIIVYRPPILPATQTVGMFSHGVIQFSTYKDALDWVHQVKDRVFHGSKLDFSFFGTNDREFQKNFSYPGATPMMGGKPGIVAPQKKYQSGPRILKQNGKFSRQTVDKDERKSNSLNSVREKRKERFSKNRENDSNTSKSSDNEETRESRMDLDKNEHVQDKHQSDIELKKSDSEHKVLSVRDMATRSLRPAFAQKDEDIALYNSDEE